MNAVTPRATCLRRAVDLRAFRDALAALAVEGAPLDARDRLLIVPTRAAAAYLVRSIEARLLASRGAVVLPDLVTPRDLVRHLGERLVPLDPVLTDAEREVLLGVACRAARDAGAEPPFRLRPGLVSEVLGFYDALRRRHVDVATFERLALGRLFPGADIDRGAERLVRQTRFLVAAFRDFEARAAIAGLDEHSLRGRLIGQPAHRPFRHVVVAVGDQAFDPCGVCLADWDLLARIPGLERLDIVVTETALAGAAHERIHRLLPGIEEVRLSGGARSEPVLVAPSEGCGLGDGYSRAGLSEGEALVHVARDREEEVATYARRVKQSARAGADVNRMALVVEQPLPYVYVAREVFRSAAVPLQMFDALPLAAEGYPAALELVFAAVASGFTRQPSIALLRSVHFGFAAPDGSCGGGHTAASGGLEWRDVAALDRELAEAGYLGETDALERILTGWRSQPQPRSQVRLALRAGDVLLRACGELAELRAERPVAEHLACLLGFLDRHACGWSEDDPVYARYLRARQAITGTLHSLRHAYARFDPTPVPFDEVTALIKRWIEAQTFAPRNGDAGVHLVDAESARFGDFDVVQLAGLVDSEWPERPRRNIFYPPEILKELGWPAESDRRDASRARFADLLRLPDARVSVSAFTLEADAIVSVSALVDEIERAGLEVVTAPVPASRIFDYEALARDPVNVEYSSGISREWAAHRDVMARQAMPARRGFTAPHRAAAFSLSALERYQDCPFKYFSSEVLRLAEDPDDGSTISPRARGRFLHEVLHRFFEAWDDNGAGTLTPDSIEEARTIFAEVAESHLARLPEADAALERTRLFGSAISIGAADIVLGIEASRSLAVRERWLEHRLDGQFSLGSVDGRRVPLRGIADRIDLLDGRGIRVVDYKSGFPPDPKRALQAPIYALCAQERLETRDRTSWTVTEASYVAFSGPRAQVTAAGGSRTDVDAFAAARDRLFAAVDGIGRGEFPPRPHDQMLCRSCAFVTVCRKDYVEDA